MEIDQRPVAIIMLRPGTKCIHRIRTDRQTPGCLQVARLVGELFSNKNNSFYKATFGYRYFRKYVLNGNASK